MSTVSKIKALFPGQYVRCEYFKPVVEFEFWSANGLRCIEGVVPEDAEVLDYRLLGEREYNLTFWMPMGEYVSFRERFDDRDAKILCIVLPKCGQFVFRRRLRIGNKAYALLIPGDSLEEAEQRVQASVVLGIWHKYLDLSNVLNKKVFEERERYYARKGKYP
ncbi:MAG: hypothetical protein K6G83_12550 [Lachnospiraceae bacterium]|nr:hypothetical protein [Lachnospiraceae bacterium]